MVFCPRCGSLLKAKVEKGKEIMYCSCGYKKEGVTHFKEKIEKKESKIDVVDSEIEVLPETDADCPKCECHVAYVWTAQTRGGDEPETKFYKCKKCKHIWRSYD